MTRPTWDQTWLTVAAVVSRRSTCPRAHVGCAIVAPSQQVTSVGYNGAPSNMPHCTDAGCLTVDDGSCVRAIHAEMNALMQARGTAAGATLYTTLSPCWRCAQLITQAGIRRVVTTRRYRTIDGIPDPIQMLINNGIVVDVFDDE